MSQRLLLGALCASVVVFCGVAVVVSARSQPTTFEQLTANPERFRGQELQVVGRIASMPRSPRNDFVLTGPDGRRLLVIPGKGVRVPSVGRGWDATVRGTVIPVEPWADDLVDDDPRKRVSAGELAARHNAAVMLRASEIRVSA